MGDVAGIFYERKKIEAGTMATKRVHSQPHDLHYYCKSNTKGEVELFYLKPTGEPTKMLMDTIDRADFDTRFQDCSTHKCELKAVSPQDAAKEKAAAKVSLEANLGKGKAHMSLGEVDKAREAFETMSKLDNLYDKENKHIFNEYGIELRRAQLYDLAIDNYNKALEIDPNDEALYFNIARALNESGNTQAAVENLQKALKLKPDFAEAKMLYGAVTKSIPAR
ncbi:MAG: tetratricopeptide repeat protein [Nitrospinae bacterium]|nr:tetratricopeptide repeat protein [Nitrospinota bacterium]